MGTKLDSFLAKHPQIQFAGDACIWLILVVSFTYYPLLNAILNHSLDFMAEYANSQKTIAALIANFAVLGLIGYDNYKSSSASHVSKGMIVVHVFCIIAILLIWYLTCLYDSNEIKDYFSSNTLWPSFTIHIVYLVLLFIIRYNTCKNYNTHTLTSITRL